MIMLERAIQIKREEIKTLSQMLDNAKQDLKKLEKQYQETKTSN